MQAKKDAPEQSTSAKNADILMELDNSWLHRLRILDGGVTIALMLLYVFGLDCVPDRFLDLATYMSQGLIFLALCIGISQVVLFRGREGYAHVKRWAWTLIGLGLVQPVIRLGFGIVWFMWG